MLELILKNLQTISIAMGLFVGAVLANTCLGLYNNIIILLQPFDKKKLINTVLKTTCVAVGIILLVVVVTVLPVFCDTVGFTIPDQYIEVFSGLTVISGALIPTCKYIKDAYDKLTAILNTISDDKGDNK